MPSFKYTCPNCGATLAAAKDLSGRKILCKKCGKFFRQSAATALEGLAPLDAEPARQPSQPPIPLVKRPFARHWRSLAVGGGVIVCLLTTLIVLSQRPPVRTDPTKTVVATPPVRKGSDNAQGAGPTDPPKMTHSGGKTKYAFIVAVSKYDEQKGLRGLPYTVSDVEKFRDALLATGYEAKNIRLLHDRLTEEQNPGFRFVPKKAEIMAELAQLLRFVEEEDSVVVVLNGHGVHFKGDKTSHFCPLDADLGRKRNLLPMDGPDGLYSLLEKCKATSKLLIAGMCRNDPGDFPADAQAAETIDLSSPDKPPAGIAALYSCEAGQKTYFDKEQGSYFFKHLSAAWRGDYAGDDELTLDAVFASVRAKTKKEVFDMSGGLKDQFPEVRRRYDGTWSIAKVVKPAPKPVPANEPKSAPKPVPLDEPKPAPKLVPTNEPKPAATLGRYGGDEKVFEIAKGVRMTFCWVPSGDSQLGSPRAEQDYCVKTYLSGSRPDRMDGETESARGKFKTKGFWMGKFEVQQSEWEGVMGADKNRSKFKGANLPVEMVSWDDCKEFIGKCGVTGLKVKLPHEDEWEYACRGDKGNKQAFYWGDVLNGAEANHNGNYPYGTTTKGEYKEKTTPVGTYKDKAAHPWGLCDMSGNVWEWCENLYTTTGSGRVVRGGGWSGYAHYCRSADRYGYAPTGRYSFLGFRLALVP